MTLDTHCKSGMGDDHVSKLRKLFSRTGPESIFVKIKQNIRHCRNQPTFGITSLQNLIELLIELGSKLGFIALRLLCCKTGCLCICSCSFVSSARKRSGPLGLQTRALRLLFRYSL